MHNDPLPERYVDLLGPQPEDDPALARLVADLDALHAAHEPSVALAAALDRAIHERIAGVASQPDRAEREMVTRAPSTSYRSQPEGRIPVTPRRLSIVFGSLAAVLVVGLMAALLLSGRPTLGLGGAKDNETPQQRFARLGGVRQVLQVACPTREPKCDYKSRLPQLIDTLQRRLDTGLGVRDADVAIVLEKDDYADVQIEVPDQTDDKTVAEAVAVRGELDAFDTSVHQLIVGEVLGDWICAPQVACQSGSYNVIFDGSQVDTSTPEAKSDANSGQPAVTFSLKQDARQRFAQFTRDHIGEYLTIALDGRVLVSAVIQSEIDGSLQVTGFHSMRDARNLVTYLKTGALPLGVSVLSSGVVPAGTTDNANPCATITPAPTPTVTPYGAATPTASPTVAIAGGAPTTPATVSGTPSTLASGICPTPTTAVTPGSPGVTTPAATPTATPPATPTPA